VRGRVTITRAAHQAEKLAAAFRAAGFTVEHLPLLEVVPPADPRPLERAVYDLESYDWLVFTSANAVDAFLPLTGGALPPDLRVAVVGPATAEALRARGHEPGLTASRPDAEGLLADLASLVTQGHRVFLPQAADARPVLAEGLRQTGAEVAVAVAYDKGLPAEAHVQAERLFRDSPIGWVTFTSPRIVHHFVDLFGEGSIGDWERRRPELLAASIGPVTSAELRRRGVQGIAEAETPGEEGLVRAVSRYGRMSAP
jgi:uroporphyrinogen III methyltransferase/synthase